MEQLEITFESLINPMLQNMLLQEKVENPYYAYTEFDDIFALAYTIGSSNKVHIKIEQLYKKKQAIYFEAFKESKYYNSPVLLKLSPANRKGVQQMISMLLIEKDLMETVVELLKEGYRYVYHQVKNVPVVDVVKVRNSVFKYTAQNNLLGTTSAFAVMTATFYLGAYLKRNCVVDSEFFIPEVIGRYAASYHQIFLNSTFDDIGTQPYLEKVYKELVEQFPILAFKPAKRLTMSHLLIQMKFEAEDKGITNPFSKIIELIGTATNFWRVNFLELQDIVTIEKKMFKKILNYYLLWYFNESEVSANQIDYEKLGMLLCTYMLTEEYKNVKEVIINSDSTIEEQLVQLEKIIKEQKAIKAQLDKEYAIITKENEELHKKQQLILEENRQLQNRLNKLEEQLEKAQQLPKEVVTEPDIEEEFKLTFEEQVAQLQSQKLVIVGGTNKWKSQLINHLPNTRFISIDDLNKDFSFIRQAELVLIHTECNTHSLYYKIQSVLKSSNVPSAFIENWTNIELAIDSIYRCTERYLHKLNI
ncbi:hypothetical protein [Bacillus mycoides]|uniref:hypothetical protein n=1 Tax=Bacillus mycoides TaxID=1405 RepID=UPI001C01DAA8|nr:hypothetical protein [Bacillus mycoides]QWG36720.1 hypothetical protein EXW30_28400 [Bacillus mycoides]